MKQSQPWSALKTKQDLQQAVESTVSWLESKFTPGSAGIKPGATGSVYNENIALMEAFARPLWGLVPLAAGGGSSKLWPLFRQGLIHGTNPDDPEYWGKFRTMDQRMVEQCVLGLGLAIAPEQLWDPLTDDQKQHVYDWLNQINLVDHSNPNNWLMFTVLVNIGFQKAGCPHNQELMNQYLELIDSYYIGDGWYSDGKTDQRDYYIAFAMHYYTLIYAKLMENEDPERAKVYKERAALFERDFIHWFAEDGSSIPFGRSLTYRFAQAAFWSALVYADVAPYSLGVMKGIILRHLRWWSDQPIFGHDDVLSIGYAYPNLNMAEGYNAPGSPYWAYKTFLVLALPDEHPFWAAEEEPLPPLKERAVQEHARMIVSRPEAGKHVVAYTSGQMANFDMSHAEAKYAKFAYSILFGFSVPKGYRGLVQGAYDSMLALSEGDNYYRTRGFCESFEAHDSYLYSLWKPWSNVQVRTWLVPIGGWHVRIHAILTERRIDAAEGGFALKKPDDYIPSDNKMVNVMADRALARTDSQQSGMINLLGYEQARMIEPEPNTNVLYPCTLIPTLTAHLEPGEHLLVSAVFGATGDEDVASEWHTPPSIKREENGRITVMNSETGQEYASITL